MRKYAIGLIGALALITSSMTWAQDYGGYGQATQPAATAMRANDIVAVASGDSSLALFVKHVNKAGLAQTLRSKGPFTVFAPDNDAFNARTKEDIDAEHKDNAVLVSTIKYHVISGKVLTAADLLKMNGQTLTMDNGMQLPVKVEGSTITVGNARVLTSDRRTSNGIIHITDRVEIPGKVMPAPAASMPMKTGK
jgi:uncharacterized surface protein with fasciclin (FAS1) repeats